MLKKAFLIFILFISQITFSYASSTEPHTYKVIIIGAGVAGLEAANYLQSHGVKDFIILEARDHIGGRAYTINTWNNIDIPLGATWLHGVSPKNPLTPLVSKWHIQTKPFDYNSQTIYNSSGEEISDAAESKYTNLYKLYRDLLTEKRKDPQKNANLSLSDVAVEFIQSKKLDKSSQAGFLAQIVDKIEEDYAADITKLSALWYDNDEGFSEKDSILLHGYKEIIEGIAKDIKNQVLLNHIVNQVDYTNKQQIIVSTTQGKQFTGEYVISTLPIGVLKKGSVKFIPALPADKLEAIQHINMGTMNKIIMLFPKVFWDTTQYITHIPPAYWSGTNWVKKGEWVDFYNLAAFINKPILFALVSGDFALQLENQSDKQIIDGAMGILRTIYGANTPNPTSYIITRWGKDPFSEGSYSSLSPGALDDGEDYLNMAKTIDDHLLFAGEATTDMYPSTVYGAYLSGDRVAEEILTHSLTDKKQ